MNQNQKKLFELMGQPETSIELQKLQEFQPKKNSIVLEKLELSLNFNVYYFQYNFGIGIAEITPNNLIQSSKTQNIVTLFGYIDYYSMFYATETFILKPNTTFIYDSTLFGIVGFNGLILDYQNDIRVINSKPDLGDLLKTYSTANAPKIDTIVSKLSTTNQIGYGSILNSLSDSKYIIQNLRIRVDKSNESVFDLPIYISRLALDGKIKTDSLNIRNFIKPSDFQTSIVDLPLNIILDKNLIINHPIKYDCQNVDYIFTLLKIK